ncbi:hypothetical protein PENNAL_c0001G01521 [Penicillium nalgiovense]|uniref:Uncharacterized protein n=1 Tax=Penicillium nalgiovense TaxID=60175 RepID=A0A1V6Z952_PENNA|nr:hypothetical protein PENNAL_c0001G01521 [Penicillium nalgiovense]
MVKRPGESQGLYFRITRNPRLWFLLGHASTWPLPLCIATSTYYTIPLSSSPSPPYSRALLSSSSFLASRKSHTTRIVPARICANIASKTGTEQMQVSHLPRHIMLVLVALHIV